LFIVSCEDVVRGQRDHLGVHNTGNVVLKTSKHGDGFIVIDGQQRITTTMLLLTALREEVTTLQLEGDTDYHDLLLTLNQVIYLKQGKDSNDSLGPSRLVPSFYDREPYYSLIASDSLHESPSDQVSYQLQAKKCFNSKIKEEVARIKNPSPVKVLEKYKEIARQQLDLFGITFVEIVNEVNLAQVFLWLQEKSLLGEAALVFNPAPGLFFTGVDMVRNLILAPVIDLSLAEQETYHRKLWLDPVESFFRGPDTSADFNKTLNEFITEKTKKLKNKSKAETTYEAAVTGSKVVSSESKLYITTYSKFITLLEAIALKISEEEPTTDKNVRASEILSADLNNFIKMRTLKSKINDGI